MIHFERFTLDNGLRVIFHKDPSTPMAVVNTVYDVGARDEDPAKTGFAHLFEHLMFGGSVNILDFDGPLQIAGGESNAFTSNDVTNYYNVLPAQNLETALWLESDRMLSLAFTDKSLEVQRSVVIEEFKQRYLNQPYGDVWLQFRPLAYKKHPYQWATIGKVIEHIEEATMEDVKAFFDKHYSPKNAILCVAGNFELDEIKEKVNHWFGDIPTKDKPLRSLPKEEPQTEFREKTIEREVPADAFYYGFKMSGKEEGLDYYTADLISDILGRGKSSRLYTKIQKELEITSEISAYILGSHDTGLLMVSGKLASGRTFEELREVLFDVIKTLATEKMEESELARIKIKIETSKVFSEQGILNKAMGLCMHELLGDADDINKEQEYYDAISVEEIQQYVKDNLVLTNCSLLKVKAK